MPGDDPKRPEGRIAGPVRIRNHLEQRDKGTRPHLNVLMLFAFRTQIVRVLFDVPNRNGRADRYAQAGSPKRKQFLRIHLKITETDQFFVSVVNPGIGRRVEPLGFGQVIVNAQHTHLKRNHQRRLPTVSKGVKRRIR